jgi:hypothetical protein
MSLGAALCRHVPELTRCGGGPPRSDANSQSGPRGSRLAAGLTIPTPSDLPLRPCARVDPLRGEPPRSDANSQSGPRGSRLAAGLTIPTPSDLPLRPCVRVDPLRGRTPAVRRELSVRPARLPPRSGFDQSSRHRTCLCGRAYGLTRCGGGPPRSDANSQSGPRGSRLAATLTNRQQWTGRFASIYCPDHARDPCPRPGHHQFTSHRL